VGAAGAPPNGSPRDGSTRQGSPPNAAPPEGSPLGLPRRDAPQYLSPQRELISRCYQHGREIRFCGHGLLAVAWSWWQVRGEQPALITTASTYRTAWRDQLLWLQVPRLHSRAAPLPAAIARGVVPPPCAAALAGDERGYLILEWPSGMDLAAVVPDFTRLRHSGGRAIIATQADRRQPWDYTLRYFAPQYGNDEDPVTGSANAVLADYWSRRLQRRRLQALQCSPAGGVVLSRIEAESIYIGGSVALLAVSSLSDGPRARRAVH
jgi:predicted PhzF superfamily epimerase YddE/YHI9